MSKNSIFPLLFVLCLSMYGQNEVAIAENFLKKGDVKMAKEVLEKRLNNDPEDYKAMAYLGEIAGFYNQWEEAIQYYKLLVAHAPSNAEYHFKYGGAMAMKVLEVSKFKALVYIPDLKKHLESAAQLDQKHVRSRRALVELYMQLPSLLGGSESKATKYANELNQIDPLEAALAHAHIHQQNKNQNKANLHYKKALSHAKIKKFGAGKNYLNYELGKIYAENDILTNPQEGLVLLNIFIKNYSYRDYHGLQWVFLRKAQIYAKMDNKPEATKFINKALAIEPGFEQARLEKIKIERL